MLLHEGRSHLICALAAALGHGLQEAFHAVGARRTGQYAVDCDARARRSPLPSDGGVKQLEA